MIRIYQHKDREVRAVQFYANYQEVEKFTETEILYNTNKHETIFGNLLNQGDFIVKDSGAFYVVPKEKFRKEYEPV